MGSTYLAKRRTITTAKIMAVILLSLAVALITLYTVYQMPYAVRFASRIMGMGDITSSTGEQIAIFTGRWIQPLLFCLYVLLAGWTLVRLFCEPTSIAHGVLIGAVSAASHQFFIHSSFPPFLLWQAFLYTALGCASGATGLYCGNYMYNRKVVLEKTATAIWYAQEDVQEVVRLIANVMGNKITNAQTGKFKSVTLFRSRHSLPPNTNNAATGIENPWPSMKTDYFTVGDWSADSYSPTASGNLLDEDVNALSTGPTLNAAGDFLIPLYPPADPADQPQRMGVLKICPEPGLLRRFYVPRAYRRLAIPLAQSIQTMISAERYQQLGALQQHRRLSAEIHDRIKQHFLAIRYAMTEIEDYIPAQHKNPVSLIEEAATTGLEEVERIQAGEIPRPVQEHGLRGALLELAHDYTTKTPMTVSVEDDGAAHPLSERIEANMYNITHEAVRNSHVHGNAAKVTIKLIYAEENLMVRIKDDGSGFEPPGQNDDNIQPYESQNGVYIEHGLTAMNRRAKQLGGSFHLKSSPGEPTEIIANIPVE